MKISSPTLKAVSIGILIIICFIPTLFVFAVVNDRKDRNQEVRSEIGNEWGAPQEFIGPVLTLPFKQTQLIDEKSVSSDGELYLFPAQYTLSATLDPSEKVRGIFHIPVYHTTLKGTATFPQFSSFAQNDSGIIYQYDHAFISFPFSDARSIDPKSSILINGKAATITPGNGMTKMLTATRGIHVATQNVNQEQRIDFDIRLAGNEYLSFVPVGDISTITFTSQIGTPSFSGAYLPKTSSLAKSGFTADWEISGLGRAFPNSLRSDDMAEQKILSALSKIKLHEGIDHYAMVDRSIKYAILFIVLTFMTFFFIEILNRLRVHPIQYLLIGVSLGLFYLLLLSFSEQMQFVYAYSIAAIMTISLISLYSRSVLKAGKHAWSVGGVLVVLYGYLYMVLNSEDYALIAGTLLLFIVIALIMYLTRAVNWYGLDEQK